MKKDCAIQVLKTRAFTLSYFRVLPLLIRLRLLVLGSLFERTTRVATFYASILLVILLSTFSSDVKGQIITGTVYRDFNGNGIKENTTLLTEIGVQSVLVCAYNTNGLLVDSTRTSAAGIYSLNTGIGSFRIEFKGYPLGLFDSKAGGSSVQFVQGGATGVDLGLNLPLEYCQSNPKIVTPCYENGSGVNNTNPVVVSLDYRDSGVSTQNVYATNGTAANMGATWGVAYDRKTKLAYFGSFLKRQTGLGLRGADGIYVIDYSTSTPRLVGGFDLEGVIPSNGGGAISLGTITRNLIASGNGIGVNDLSASRTNTSRDADAYGKVGKVSYGDIDIDYVHRKLWAVNLFERSLISIDISADIHGTAIPTTVSGSKVKRYFINGTSTPFIAGLPSASSGTLRPFALSFHNGIGYLGVVDDGASLTAVDMTANQKAYVLSFDPVNPTAFTIVATLPLNYIREQSWVPFAPTTTFDALESDQWQRWHDTYVDPTTFGSTRASTNDDIKTGLNGLFVGAPQPILSDIDFLPNGDMVLGFMDRFAHQQGWANLIPTSATVTRNAVSHGDIILASKSSVGYVFEGPNENDNLTNPAVPTNAQAAQKLNDGPAGGGEFFYTDYYIGSDATHPETALGGLAVLPGSNEVTTIAFDPAAFNAMGVRWLNYNTGIETRVYTVAANTDISNFGKGAGLGDVELLCANPSIQVGNRLWIDSNKNGIQDAGEMGIAGIKVALFDSLGTTKLGEVTTNTLGTYYFDTLNVVGGVLLANTKYQIKVLKAAISDTLELTTINSGINDVIDSDASLVGTDYSIVFYTGNYGENNHSYDMGFVCAPPIVGAIVATNATCSGGTINNDAKIDISGILGGTRYSYGTNKALFSYATSIGFIGSTLSLEGIPNPTIATTYYVRVYNESVSCFTDMQVILSPKTCSIPCGTPNCTTIDVKKN